MDLSKLKVAIVCDWLTGPGGAERVVLELHNLFPDAPIYTSQYDPKRAIWFNGLDIRTGWLQKLPSGLKKFLPVFRALYFSRLDLSEFDLIISSSGAEAKYVKRRLSSTHIAYIHAPTHYYWSRYDEYLKNPGFGRFDWLARWALKILVGPMRKWDYRAAQRADKIIANSTHTQGAIKQYYHRDSEVVFPPVNLDRFKSLTTNHKRSGLVCVSRLTPYKRIDLAVLACNDLKVPLAVLGGGPELKRLKAMAENNIAFIENPTDSDVNQALFTAKGFIFPGLDDFGIAPVEALSAGVPVIAFRGGGALDYIDDQKNGVFFGTQSVASLKQAINQFFKKSYSPTAVKKSAKKFSEASFQRGVVDVIKNTLK